MGPTTTPTTCSQTGKFPSTMSPVQNNNDNSKIIPKTIFIHVVIPNRILRSQLEQY